MTAQTRNMATGGLILAAVILALWLMNRKTGTSVVRMTTRTGVPIQGTPGPKPGDPNFVGPVLGPGDSSFVGPVAGPGAGVPAANTAGGWDVASDTGLA